MRGQKPKAAQKRSGRSVQPPKRERTNLMAHPSGTRRNGVKGRSVSLVHSVRARGLAPTLATQTAIKSTRRIFLGRSLQGMLGLGASAAFITSAYAETASAHHSYACGPSPICGGSHGAPYSEPPCKSPCKKRCYGGFTCTTSGCGQCWLGGSGTYVYCCDCCCPADSVPDGQPGHQYNSCTNCGAGSWRACIRVYQCC